MADRFTDETIHLDNVRVRCIIGVNPEERVREQPLLISLRIPWDFGEAAATDDLAHTVNYSAVADEARRFAREGRFMLLETLARRLAVHLCDTFALSRLSLTLRKPEVVADSDGPAVSLTLERDCGPGGQP